MRTCSKCGEKEGNITVRGTVLCVDCYLLAYRQVGTRAWRKLKERRRKIRALYRGRS
jgi:hypothetical protein